MQGVQTLGTSVPQQAQQRQSTGNWRTWHSPEADFSVRKQLTQHIVNLFTQRQKQGITQEWTEKMPDFVRRLEEALYKTAQSKEEYGDPRTLEQRLQLVARRMVSNSGRRPGQGSMPSNLPTANGFSATNPLAHAPNFNSGQPSFTQQQMPQQFAGPPTSALLSAGSAGLGNLQTSAGVPSMHNQLSSGFMGNPMQGLRPLVGSPQVGGSNLSAASGLKLEQQGMSGLAMQGMDTVQSSQQGNPMARAPGGGPMMSNGAPVIMRNTRDSWAQSGQPPMLNGLSAVPQASKITINGVSPGQLAGGIQGSPMPSISTNGPTMSMQMQQPPRSPALRMGGGNMMPLSNGMIPTMSNQNNLGNSPMVPLSMQHSGQLNPLQADARRPGSGGMVPVSSNSMPGLNLPGMPSIGGGSEGSMMRTSPLGQMNGGLGNHGMMPSTSGAQPSPSANGAAGGGEQGTEAEFQSKLNGHNKEYIAKQQRWLLFLRHCAKCNAQQGECQYGQSCTVAKALWRHILECANPQCAYPRCVTSRELLKHHQKCQSHSCPVCTPVKQYVQKQRLAMQQQQQHRLQEQQHRMNMERTPQGMATPMSSGPMHAQHARSQMLQQQQQHQQQQQQQRMAQQQQFGGMYNVGTPNLMMNQQQPLPSAGMRRSASQMANGASHPEEPPGKRYRNVLTGENKGTSLLEAFTLEDIRAHLRMLREGSAAGGAGPGKGYVHPPNYLDENACHACGGTRLTFEPAAIYCSICVQKIKRNQVYYSTPPKMPEVKGNWCHSCFMEERKETLEIDGAKIKKCDVVKRKNDEEQEEAWVACDQCNRWVHQICGLFNKGRNDSDVPYICPECLARGLEMGIRKPIDVRPQAMLEAKDLPRCSLSDYIEDHLRQTVAEDRLLRAKQMGRTESEVPAAEGLTVRVVNNINKKMEVKPRFLETFRNEGFTDSFPYKQKVIVLFQRINGVDVALYCLYMQEYGDDCGPPNKRWVYLSYLDSIKYFEPEISSAARPGIALRTLVYHDILLSYMAYIKQRGYCAMFIWACPPFQGDDYILHCHPSRQKLPRSDRLREWYLSMLRTGKEKGLVTHLSNLFDTFFEGGRDHKEKASATCMPYLDGDYWPGEAENLLNSISEEARVAGKKTKKASNSKGAARPGKKGKRYGLGSTDEQLMGKLGETIQGMKEDFIVVHLQEPCSFCRSYISDTHRWYHPAPPAKVVVKQERSFEGINLETPGALTKQTAAITRFQLCHSCYENERSGQPGKMRGLPAGIALADLQSEKMELIAPTHDTGNPNLASEFFDTRQAFLSLCQGNHYQFDTLRRAKHSSMMVLYHLHNPEAPAFACTCNNCQREIEPGAGYRCPECQDYDLCVDCHHRGVQHPHKLMANVRSVNETQVRLTQEQQADRAAQLQRTMNLLVHASACSKLNCPSSNCSKVKALFKHAVHCQMKVSGGCQLCRRMWALLQLHAKQCQEAACPVPRCRELREMRRRQVARQEAQRRSGYQAMLRQQAKAGQQQLPQMNGDASSSQPGY